MAFLEMLRFLEKCHLGVEISNFDDLGFCSVVSHVLMKWLWFPTVVTEREQRISARCHTIKIIVLYFCQQDKKNKPRKLCICTLK